MFRNLFGLAIGVLMFSVGASAQPKPPGANPDRDEVYRFVLTMDNVRKMNGARRALLKVKPDTKEQRPAHTVNEMVRNVEASPAVMSVLRSNGLSAREYIVGVLALTKAMNLVAAKKASRGGPSDPVAALSREVSPANERFVSQHWEDLRKLFEYQPTR